MCISVAVSKRRGGVSSIKYAVRRWAEIEGMSLERFLDYYGAGEFAEMCGMNPKIQDIISDDLVGYVVGHGCGLYDFIDENAQKIADDFDIIAELEKADEVEA